MPTLSDSYFYPAIDPVSSSIVRLNNFSTTPNMQVQMLRVPETHELITSSFVGCDVGFTFELDDAVSVIMVTVEIQSTDMDDVWNGIESLRTACAGDVSIPDGDGTFNFVIARKNNDYYGYKACRRTRFDADWRPKHYDNGTEYPFVEAPYMTLVYIEAETRWPDLRKLDTV